MSILVPMKPLVQPCPSWRGVPEPCGLAAVLSPEPSLFKKLGCRLSKGKTVGRKPPTATCPRARAGQGRGSRGVCGDNGLPLLKEAQPLPPPTCLGQGAPLSLSPPPRHHS